MRKLLLSILLVLLLQPAFSTSIVILITPDYILLGADSRRMKIDHYKNQNSYLSVCKIRSLGNYCYAMAGLIASEKNGFSADSIVNKYLNGSSNYNTAVRRITNAISKKLREEIRNRKKDNPNVFEDTFINNQPLLEVAILSVKDNKPFVQIIGFKLADKKLHIKTYTTQNSTGASHQKNKIYLLGQYSGMESYLKEPGTEDPVLMIEEMISVQSEVTPVSVAKPINIIRYSTNGVEWIQ